jgi:hypothetical protein
VAAADIEIVHEMAVLDVKAVARSGVAMCDQDALCTSLIDLDMGFDGVAAAPDVGRDIGRHMAHAGVKGEMVTRTMETGGVFRKTRAEPIVERQHLMPFRLAPPGLDHGGEALRLLRSKIVHLGEIAIEMEELPFVVLERRAGRVIGDRFPALMPEAAMAEHLEILRA